jgi:glycosyltransferase involved in cell wall biosynthesis
VRALGLEPGRYVLYVSRMEPENNALLVRQAFEKVETDFKLAIIGDAPYAADYIRQVKDTTDKRISHSGRRLWRRLPPAAVALRRVCASHRGGRHSPG